MPSVQHYCQKCLAANPLGQELCARCGTRLMLVVEPPTARFEDGGLVALHEEHLLERISAIENRLMRLTDKLQQTLNLMLKQARNAYVDHALIDALIDVLNEAGSLDAVKLNKLWRERCQQDTIEQEETVRFDQLRSKILAANRDVEPVAFERLVSEAIDLLKEKEIEKAVRTLERAVAFDSKNAPLNAFLGEHFFEKGRNTLARDYLERALASGWKSESVRLLLGIACGDMGEVERARELLKDSVKRVGESFSARYGLGRLFAAEGKWAEALREFKAALAARPSPEAHYVLGCAYLKLVRDRLAVRHLRKAIELDQSYVVARYALGIALLRSGESVEARNALQAVSISDVDEPHHRASARRILRSGKVPANPKLLEIIKDTKKGLITGGDKRLAEVLRQDALNIIRTRITS